MAGAEAWALKRRFNREAIYSNVDTNTRKLLALVSTDPALQACTTVATTWAPEHTQACSDP